MYHVDLYVNMYFFKTFNDLKIDSCVTLRIFFQLWPIFFFLIFTLVLLEPSSFLSLHVWLLVGYFCISFRYHRFARPFIHTPLTPHPTTLNLLIPAIQPQAHPRRSAYVTRLFIYLFIVHRMCTGQIFPPYFKYDFLAALARCGRSLHFWCAWPLYSPLPPPLFFFSKKGDRQRAYYYYYYYYFLEFLNWSGCN